MSADTIKQSSCAQGEKGFSYLPAAIISSLQTFQLSSLYILCNIYVTFACNPKYDCISLYQHSLFPESLLPRGVAWQGSLELSWSDFHAGKVSLVLSPVDCLVDLSYDHFIWSSSIQHSGMSGLL